MDHQIILGAVAYDPKVVTIWEGFRDWFATHNFDFDFILYSNYERQVEGHFAGHFDVAWNSPLAWLESERVARERGRTAEAVCMRDTDCDLTSLVVARAGSGIEKLEDLRGKVVAVGAPDSPQATLIPLLLLKEAGLEPGRDFEVQQHDKLFGKHGDHIGGERDAARALVAGKADAACMIDGNHLLFTSEGTLPSGSTTVLAQTDPYDHCCFTVLDGADTAMLHRTDGEVATGDRVRPVWAPHRVGSILDILHFERAEGERPSAPEPVGGDPVTRFEAPTRIDYRVAAGATTQAFLRGVMARKLLGSRCPDCTKVYIPPRGSCPTCAVAPEAMIELSQTGTVTTFSVIRLPFEGQVLDPPYACAHVLLDGADVPLLHIVGECDPDEVRMGMRVTAVWADTLEPTLASVRYFRPVDEPDVDYAQFKEHV